MYICCRLISFTLLFISSLGLERHNQRRRLKCSSYNWHEKAKDGYEDADIFRDTDIQAKYEAQKAAQPILEQSMNYIRLKHSNDTVAELATLDPSYSNCTWLKVNLIDRAGLGHTFACWAHYLKVSLENRLTLHYPFYSPDHEVCNLNDTTHFFGLHRYRNTIAFIDV